MPAKKVEGSKSPDAQCKTQKKPLNDIRINEILNMVTKSHDIADKHLEDLAKAFNGKVNEQQKT